MFLNVVFLVLFTFKIVHSIPCPLECICKPMDMNDMDFTRMAYRMDCSSQLLNNDRLVYHADEWTINEDRIVNDDDDDNSVKDYIISIDLSNLLSVNKFTSRTIELTGFSFLLQSLSLTNQPESFLLETNSFDSPLYTNLKLLNLSSCCQQIPNDCSQIFRPLNQLQILDLSGSEMYKTCLSTPDMISSKLTDLILRNNIYDQTVFSSASDLFNGVRNLPGKLDLQNSRFEFTDEPDGNCLFNIFQKIKILDLSSIEFSDNSNETEIYLTYLLKCEILPDGNRNGEQLLDLYLRQLQLQQLPEWFNNTRFPLLRRLDLSNNNFYTIDINTFRTLRYISLAYNPIDLENIVWRDDTIYKSINLRSTARNRNFSLSRHLKNLFKLSANIDYSENEAIEPSNITNIRVGIDFPIALNISRTNIQSFQVNFNNLLRLDISFNSLIELNLDKYQKLNSLDCSNQYLKSLKFNDQLSDLIQLKCSNNSLETIENFSLLKIDQLKLIDLSYNSIDSLENLFTNLTSRFLRIINLKFNRIEIIPTNIFHRKLFSLYEINLSWNRIHTIQTNAFQTPNLQILDLTGNSLINIEPNAILTVSLRLFYVFNNTQQINDRCLQSKSYDNLLSLYINWLKTNGSRMKNNQIEFDQCLNRYFNQTKINWIITKGKHFFGHYILYIITSLSIMGLLIIGIYLYRRNQLTFCVRFQRYKPLDRNILTENSIEMEQRQNEDDEIVMNIQEPPFNKFSRVRTYV